MRLPAILALVLGLRFGLAPAYAAPAPGCMKMVENLCAEAFSEKWKGNVDYRAPDGTNVRTRLGTTDGDIDYLVMRELELKVAAIPKYPSDFAAGLRKFGFAEKVRGYLAPFGKRLDWDSRVKRHSFSVQYGDAWNNALEEAVVKRLAKLYPGLASTPRNDMPESYSFDYERIRAELERELSDAVWKGTAEWKALERRFAEVKAGIQDVLKESKSVPREALQGLAARIKSVSLLPPGAGKYNVECQDGGAWYIAQSDEIEVCSDVVIGHDPTLTLAHELGHAIGPDRSILLLKRESEVGQRIIAIGHSLCEKRKVDCNAWTGLSSGFEGLSQGLRAFHPWSDELFSCVHTRKTSLPDTAHLRKVAAQHVADAVDELARDSSFLDLAKPETLKSTGQAKVNETFANPCKLSDPTYPASLDPLYEDNPILIFFSAEILCSQEKDPVKRFRASLERAIELGILLEQREIVMSGGHTGGKSMSDQNFAEDVDEHASDALAAKLMERELKRIPDLETRRMTLLANTAWMCERPGIRSKYPAEARIEEEYFWDNHSKGLDRWAHFMTGGMRELLGCKKDFDTKACELR